MTLDIPLAGRWGRKALILDILERAVVVLLFAAFVSRVLPRYLTLPEFASTRSAAEAIWTVLGAGLLLFAEGLAVVLILIRKPGLVSVQPVDWLLGFAGATAPLLAHPAAAGPGPLWPAYLAMLAGMLLQIWAKLSLGRSFGVVPAARDIKTAGPYRFVRHPMYLGYAVTHAGFLIGFPSTYNTVLYGSALLIEIARILREEQILLTCADYSAYAKRVRYRMIPFIF